MKEGRGGTQGKKELRIKTREEGGMKEGCKEAEEGRRKKEMSVKYSIPAVFTIVLL